MSDTLSAIASKYGLDKSIDTGNHNYIPGYETLFGGIRDHVRAVLEIGIGSLEHGEMGGTKGELASSYGYRTGNSLRCWREYFPKASIYGIDIYEHREVDMDRIKTFVADQGNVFDLTRVVNSIGSSVDIIIDDGSHQAAHQIFSFMYLSKFLSYGGIYVIEDIQSRNIEGFKSLRVFPESFRRHIRANFDVQWFDTREEVSRPDDFMMSFKRKV